MAAALTAPSFGRLANGNSCENVQLIYFEKLKDWIEILKAQIPYVNRAKCRFDVLIDVY